MIFLERSKDGKPYIGIHCFIKIDGEYYDMLDEIDSTGKVIQYGR